MDVVGALEYDPELAVRQNHRAFLREHVIFKEVYHSTQILIIISLSLSSIIIMMIMIIVMIIV